MMSFLSLSFFKPAKAILVPGIYYEIDISINLGRNTTQTSQRTFLGFSRYSKRVSSFHVIPLLTLAAVYEKPSACPVLRPNKL